MGECGGWEQSRRSVFRSCWRVTDQRKSKLNRLPKVRQRSLQLGLLLMLKPEIIWLMTIHQKGQVTPKTEQTTNPKRRKRRNQLIRVPRVQVRDSPVLVLVQDLGADWVADPRPVVPQAAAQVAVPLAAALRVAAPEVQTAQVARHRMLVAHRGQLVVLRDPQAALLVLLPVPEVRRDQAVLGVAPVPLEGFREGSAVGFLARVAASDLRVAFLPLALQAEAPGQAVALAVLPVAFRGLLQEAVELVRLTVPDHRVALAVRLVAFPGLPQELEARRLADMALPMARAA
jgi:hypothetical protein